MDTKASSLLVGPQHGTAFQLATDFVVIKVRASQTQGQYRFPVVIAKFWAVRNNALLHKLL
jgi:hypothetical protein